MRKNREARALERTFRDHLNVYRMHLARDPVTQATVEVEGTVYEDVRCALSQKNNNVPERQEFHSETKQEHVIFTAPGIELLDNDRAVVRTEVGQTFEGTAGRTFGYASHGETSFRVEKIT